MNVQRIRIGVGQVRAVDPDTMAWARQLGITTFQMNTPDIPGDDGVWHEADLRRLCKGRRGGGRTRGKVPPGAGRRGPKAADCGAGDAKCWTACGNCALVRLEDALSGQAGRVPTCATEGGRTGDPMNMRIVGTWWLRTKR